EGTKSFAGLLCLVIQESLPILAWEVDVYETTALSVLCAAYFGRRTLTPRTTGRRDENPRWRTEPCASTQHAPGRAYQSAGHQSDCRTELYPAGRRLSGHRRGC